jgi:hypothetical protein
MIHQGRITPLWLTWALWPVCREEVVVGATQEGVVVGAEVQDFHGQPVAPGMGAGGPRRDERYSHRGSLP